MAPEVLVSHGNSIRELGLRSVGNMKVENLTSFEAMSHKPTEDERDIAATHDIHSLARRGMLDPVTQQQLQKFSSRRKAYKHRDTVMANMSRIILRKQNTVLSEGGFRMGKCRSQSSESLGELAAHDPSSPAGCRHAWQEHQDDDLDEEQGWHVLLREVVLSPGFDYGSGALVVLNAIVLGVQTDWQAREVTNDLIWPFRVLEVLFCIAFATELGMRFAAYGRRFFAPEVRNWHVLDSVLVCSQVLDFITSMVANGDEGSENIGKNFSTLRLVRFLRLMRVTRLVRVLRLIGELRTLVMSIVGALRHLSWAVTLLLLLMYVMGVYITQLTLDHRLDHDLTRDAVASSDAVAAMIFYYGSLGDTILSVYKAVTGGVDWGDILEPLRERISIWTVPAFMMYIAFVMLCVLNVITGVFVESALATAKRDRASVMVSNVKSVFDQYDKNNSGMLNWDEFKDACDSKDMKTILASLEIDSSEAEGLFHLLDVKETGHVTPQEFAIGCVRLSGTSKALDLGILMREFMDFLSDNDSHARRVDAHLKWIVDHLEQARAS